MEREVYGISVYRHRPSFTDRLPISIFPFYDFLPVSHRFQFVLPSKAPVAPPNRFRVIGVVIKQGVRARKNYEKSCTQIAGNRERSPVDH